MIDLVRTTDSRNYTARTSETEKPRLQDEARHIALCCRAPYGGFATGISPADYVPRTVPEPDLPLHAISARTIGHYEASAESYRDGTRDHDVSQNVAALLAHIRGQPPFDILDFGCGPGRDLKTFAALGHRDEGGRTLPGRRG